jgi:hypothetical protein
MSTSVYFASNQAKQKAFDRYYNAMAKSDFKQGVKLRALIEQNAADSSLVDQLASLYLQAVGKTRDYEYDTIDDKLKKAAPPVIKNGKKKEVKVSIDKSTKKPKRVYVHETTDTPASSPKKKQVDEPMGVEVDEYEDKAPIPSEVQQQNIEEREKAAALNSLMRSSKTNDFVQKMASSYKDFDPKDKGKKQREYAKHIEQAVSNYVNSVNRTKASRQDVMMGNRLKNTAKAEAQKTIFETIVEEIRNQTPPPTPPRAESPKQAEKRNRSPQKTINRSPNDRDRKKPHADEESKKSGSSSDSKKTSSTEGKDSHKTSSTDAEEYDEEFKEGLKQEKSDRKYNTLAQTNIANLFDNWDPESRSKVELYKRVKHSFEAGVDRRKGSGYWDANAPKPSEFGSASVDNMKAFMADLRGFLDGIFIVKN